MAVARREDGRTRWRRCSTCSPPVPDEYFAAGGPVELERERLAVGAGPLGDDVGDDATVVVGVEVDRFAGRGDKVDAVHPHVAGEADVEQVRQRLTTDRLGEARASGSRAIRRGSLRAGPQRARVSECPIRR